MTTTTESHPLLQVVQRYLESHKLGYNLEGDGTSLTLGLHNFGTLIGMTVNIETDHPTILIGMQNLALRQMTNVEAALEFAGHTNWSLRGGCFAVDPSDGEVTFRTTLFVGTASIDVAHVHAVMVPALRALDRYTNGWMAVERGMAPAQAAEYCQRGVNPLSVMPPVDRESRPFTFGGDDEDDEAESEDVADESPDDEESAGHPIGLPGTLLHEIGPAMRKFEETFGARWSQTNDRAWVIDIPTRIYQDPRRQNSLHLTATARDADSVTFRIPEVLEIMELESAGRAAFASAAPPLTPGGRYEHDAKGMVSARFDVHRKNAESDVMLILGSIRPTFDGCFLHFVKASEQALIADSQE